MSAKVLAPKGISCHAWNKDHSQVAICPNSNVIEIYEVASWKLLYSLKEHDLLVSGIDWDGVNNRIVSCSHDRNAFVWTYVPSSNGEPAIWKPALVILRLDRAAMDVKWDLRGTRFAVASCSKVIPVCTYDGDNDWWVSRHIKKKIKSTVTCVAFHPTNSQILAAGSSDFKCRVFSTFSADVDGGEIADVKSTPFPSPVEFGDVYCEFTALGWINSVAWSPSGNILCFAAHDSTIHFVNITGNSSNLKPQTIKCSDLPMQCLLFAHESCVLGGGYDNNPAVYECDGKGFWSFGQKLDQKDTSPANAAVAGSAASGVGAARALFQSKTKTGQDSKADGDTLWTKHENAITGMSLVRGNTVFTSSLDGKVVLWDPVTLSKAMKDVKM